MREGPHRLNSALGGVLLVILAIAPIPLGSNRPAFWAIWAVVLGLVATGYAASLLFLKAPARFSVADFWPEAFAMALLLVWLAFQCIDIRQWLPVAPVVTGQLERSVSLDPGSTRLTALNFLTYGLLFALFVQAGANRRRARSLLLALFVIIAAFAVFGLASLVQLDDTLLGFDKVYYLGSATGTFINRNSFATFLAAGLAIGVPLLATSLAAARAGQMSSWTQPVIVFVGLLFIAATLLATGSRMGALAGGMGALVALVLCVLTSEKRSGNFWVVAIAMAGMIAVVVAYGSGTLERLILTSDEATRGELYRQVWAAIWARPWTGYGGGSFATVFPAFQHPPLTGDVVWDKAHSTYLALWFELGLIGGSLPLLTIVALLGRAGRAVREPSSRAVSIAALSTGIVFGLHSVVDFSAEIMANGFLLTAVLALGASAKPSQAAVRGR